MSMRRCIRIFQSDPQNIHKRAMMHLLSMQTCSLGSSTSQPTDVSILAWGIFIDLVNSHKG